MIAFPLSALAALLIAGCPDDSSLVRPTPGPDATTVTDSSVAPDSSTAPKASLRIAHLLPILNDPAVDVCIRSASTPDAGPVDAGEDAGDAGETADAGGGGYVLPPILEVLGVPDGIKYRDVTKYLDVSPTVLGLIPPGPLKAIFVPAAGNSCENRIGGEIDLAPLAFKVGDRGTIAVFPLGIEGKPTVKVLGDLPKGDASRATVRFLNASPVATLDFGTGTGTSFAPLAESVGPGKTLAAGLGYVPSAALSNATVSFRATGSDSYVSAVGVNAPAGSLTSVFAFGASPLEILVCKDSADPVGNRTDCSLAKPDAGGDAGDGG
ncbi:hypothetical protein [Pendulispora albinea]|uniref:DUF4397 domain-containing protein n=1 Tax=Pendulispora albinea TaxID=2741071 RepID=A0ABZ2LN56_9BACT